jgi:hypothetical protein
MVTTSSDTREEEEEEEEEQKGMTTYHFIIISLTIRLTRLVDLTTSIKERGYDGAEF